MIQVGRNLTGTPGGFLVGKHFLIMDRDRKYCEGFRSLLEEFGTNVLRLPPRSPNLNAYAERFVLSIKQECLERMIFFSEKSLRRAVSTYMAHYHRERNHQGLNNRLIEPERDAGKRGVRVCCRERLGGMLRYYYREAE
jgi:transposase InsO family protein